MLVWPGCRMIELQIHRMCYPDAALLGGKIHEIMLVPVPASAMSSSADMTNSQTCLPASCWGLLADTIMHSITSPCQLFACGFWDVAVSQCPIPIAPQVQCMWMQQPMLCTYVPHSPITSAVQMRPRTFERRGAMAAKMPKRPALISKSSRRS